MLDFDGGLKYRGFSLEGEYYWRWLDNFKGAGTPMDCLHSSTMAFNSGFGDGRSQRRFNSMSALENKWAVWKPVGFSCSALTGFPWKNKVVRGTPSGSTCAILRWAIHLFPSWWAQEETFFIRVWSWRFERLRITSPQIRKGAKKSSADSPLRLCAFGAFVCSLCCAFIDSGDRANAANDYLFNDTHFHLTNYIQEGIDIHDFLKIMGNKAGRVALFGIPLQQQWSYRVDDDRAPTYYLNSDAPLYYYSFTDAWIATAYKSLSKQEQARFDPMITGFNPTDMYAADHIRRVLKRFPECSPASASSRFIKSLSRQRSRAK